MRTYQETIDWLFTNLPMFQRVGASAMKADLTNITALCEYLGNPQTKFKTVHIAGTNGKGSIQFILLVIVQVQKRLYWKTLPAVMDGQRTSL